MGSHLRSVITELLDHFVSDGVDTSDESILLVESFPDESLSLIVAGGSIDFFNSFPEDLEEINGEFSDSGVEGGDSVVISSLQSSGLLKGSGLELKSSGSGGFAVSSLGGFNSSKHSLSLLGNESSELNELLLSEDWEVLGDESVEEGLDLGLLAFTTLEFEGLFIGVINIFDESFESLSLGGDWGVTLDLESEVSNKVGESIFDGLD